MENVCCVGSASVVYFVVVSAVGVVFVDEIKGFVFSVTVLFDGDLDVCGGIDVVYVVVDCVVSFVLVGCVVTVTREDVVSLELDFGWVEDDDGKSLVITEE